ncbi:anti-sigma factor family protein [Streptomyces gobiensis]|uniref:anti-sigma factor family protein n=1 Tax=Streptomyces gobiensis TaxID=2875706 RepID=UPI001E5B57A0|nr:zf-HC2 domain-containing protein [Streptomyces gobiensis]UGY94608.1 zf-HC2 domain-containing protein [Streptomyces gobiensis]
MTRSVTPQLRSWAACREKIRHLRLRGDVAAYVDGELTGVHRARVAAHLGRCWSCSGDAESLRLIKTSLRNGPQRAPASLASVRLRRFASRLAAPAGFAPSGRYQQIQRNQQNQQE